MKFSSERLLRFVLRYIGTVSLCSACPSA